VTDFANAVHVKTDDQGAVISALSEVLARAGYDAIVGLGEHLEDGPDPSKSRLRRFLVSPSIDGWVSVFDENFVEIFYLGAPLSLETGFPSLFLWSQTDRSWGYALFDEGRSIDQYSTDPNMLDCEPVGRPDVLCEYSRGTAEQFRLLFAEGKGLARTSMRVLAKLFGIVNAESDYEDLSSGDSSNVECFEEFVPMTFLRR